MLMHVTHSSLKQLIVLVSKRIHTKVALKDFSYKISFFNWRFSIHAPIPIRLQPFFWFNWLGNFPFPLSSTILLFDLFHFFLQARIHPIQALLGVPRQEISYRSFKKKCVQVQQCRSVHIDNSQNMSCRVRFRMPQKALTSLIERLLIFN